MKPLLPPALAALLLHAATTTQAPAQQSAAAPPRVFDTFTPGPCSPNGQLHGGCTPGSRIRIRVVPVARGLDRPWHIAFLPDGNMLVTETAGRLRIIRDGRLAPEPVAGWPVAALAARTLNSVVVHPQFAQNRFVYLSYSKGDEQNRTTMALARARFDGTSLTDVRDVFVADAWQPSGALAGRAAFGPDGMVYLTVGDRDRFVTTDDNSARMLAQDLNSHVGKVLRLRDDGSVPPDNPFVGRAGAKPEIFTYGHRNVQGLAWHPETGAMWATEIGPMGGDEVNILQPGRNYGWPLVSLGKIYNSHLVSEQSWYRPGMEMPVAYWMPAISPSSLMIYSGDKFPAWKGHLFVGALSGQQIQRLAFDQPPPQTERRESLLTQLDVRVRDVRQGPDGNIYVATEHAEDTTGYANPNPDRRKSAGGPQGMILRIEPAE
jgi:glucose/arabinose dehydrogenase